MLYEVRGMLVQYAGRAVCHSSSLGLVQAKNGKAFQVLQRACACGNACVSSNKPRTMPCHVTCLGELRHVWKPGPWTWDWLMGTEQMATRENDGSTIIEGAGGSRRLVCLAENMMMASSFQLHLTGRSWIPPSRSHCSPRGSREAFR